MAEIAVMGAQGAANIIFRKEMAEAEDKVAKRAEMIKIYEDEFNNPYVAASRGYVDAIIRPSETRARLIDALEILCTKSESLPPKKHGNIPM
jgi:acetyl-CoA carboxylase carboxyltransferase component